MRRVWFGVLWVSLVSGSAFAQPGLKPGVRFLVLPFENPAREVRVYWLGEAAAVLLADDLNGVGSRAYTREERLDAFAELQVPPVASLSHASVIRLGQVVGATHVVIGSFRLNGGQISVRAQNIRLDSGRMEQEIVESGPYRGSLWHLRIVSAAALLPPTRHRQRRPAGRRCLCSRTTSRVSSRRQRLRRSAISKRPSSSIRRSIALAWRCGRSITTKETVRPPWSPRRRSPRNLADVHARALQRGAVADSAQAPGRCVCDAACDGRPRADSRPC